LNTVGTLIVFFVHFVNEACIIPVQILNGGAGLRFHVTGHAGGLI